MELSCVPYVLGRGGHFRRERKRLPGRADDARSGGWQLALVGPGDCNILGACDGPLLTGKADGHDFASDHKRPYSPAIGSFHVMACAP